MVHTSMQCFVTAGLGACQLTPKPAQSLSCLSDFAGRNVQARRVRSAHHRIAPTAPRCQEFNYNIYQDDEDRSRRSVGPNERAVTLQKPLGLVLEEGQDGMVFVAQIDAEGNAADSGEVSEGDVVVAVSATFGEEVWSTRGVGLDRVLKSIRIRSGDFVTLVLESPEQLGERMSYSAKVAENRRKDAREKFGEREVLDPVSWQSVSKNRSALYEDNIDPQQASIDEELKRKLKDEIVAPYKQNWILWISGGIFLLVILATILGLQ